MIIFIRTLIQCTTSLSSARVALISLSDSNLSALYLKYIQDLNQAATIMQLSSIQPQGDLLRFLQSKGAIQPLGRVDKTPSTRIASRDDGFSCPKCTKTYLRQYTLNAHLRYECGKRPKFKCPFCNKKCHQKCNLKSHIALKHDHVTTQMNWVFFFFNGRVFFFSSECGQWKIVYLRNGRENE